MAEILDIVDEEGIPTGEVVDRNIAHSLGILHRTAHVWLLREKDDNIQVLLQKEVRTKIHFLTVLIFQVQVIFQQVLIIFLLHCVNLKRNWDMKQNQMI